MFKIIPHISEKSVILAKRGYFTIEVPSDFDKGNLVSVLRSTFKLKPLGIKVVIKKTVLAKKAKRTVSDRGLKKMIVKLGEKQIMPGFESFLTEAKEGGKKSAKVKSAK